MRALRRVYEVAEAVGVFQWNATVNARSTTTRLSLLNVQRRWDHIEHSSQRGGPVVEDAFFDPQGLL